MQDLVVQARLANPGLADDGDDLAVALLRRRQRLTDARNLGFTAHELREGRGSAGLRR